MSYKLSYASCFLLLLFVASVSADTIPLSKVTPFLQKHCADCHSEGADAGDFEIDSLASELSKPDALDTWQLIHDRIKNGEMPPAEAEQPSGAEIKAVLQPIAASISHFQRSQLALHGRVTARRLNAIEFETTLSDLLQTPLDIADLLPADAKADGFSTVGSALNISRVQMEAYLEAIDAAIDQAVHFTERPKTQTFRLSLLNNRGYMQVYRDQHPALPVIDGMNLYAVEKMSAHHALWGHYVVPRRGKYRIKVSAYTVNTNDPLALTLRVGGSGHKESLRVKHRLLEHFEIESNEPTEHVWEGELLRGHFLHLYPSELPKRRFPINEKYEQVHYDGPGVCVQWLEIEGPIVEEWPPAGEQRLFGGVALERIPGTRNQDPNAQLKSPPIIPADPLRRQKDWPPGGNQWKHLAGEVNEQAKFVAADYSRRRAKVIKKIKAGQHPHAKPLPDYRLSPHNLLLNSPLPTYGGEPIYDDVGHPGDLVRTLRLAPVDPKADADRLIRRILPVAFRRQVSNDEGDRYVALVHRWLDEGSDFESAMRTGYKAVFTSPAFLFHQSSLPEQVTRSISEGSTAFALAERLSYFLWNTAPDEQLLRLASSGRLHDQRVLREQTDRLLRDPRSVRFVEDFLGQWLDLYEINFTTPDEALFPEYDVVLHWSMLAESHAYFRHMLDDDLPANRLVDSEFATINRRLAQHYNIRGVHGMNPKPIRLPDDSPRGGVMTQAAVLKVTANGTNTSPVVRGVWINERILGTPPPPPPPGVPAVEPDIRGAKTIREQLEHHRSDSACASCHAKIDPPGIALESFDPVGRYRDRYRVLNPQMADAIVYDLRKRYQNGLPVDPAYELATGETFSDIRELKAIYASDPHQIAKTITEHLIVYSTGAKITFSDRDAIHDIVEQTKVNHFGLRSIVHAVVQSDLFRQR